MTIDSRTQANNRPYVPGTTNPTTATTPITNTTPATTAPNTATASMDRLNTEGGQEIDNVLTGMRTANSATDAAAVSQIKAAQQDAALYSLLEDDDYDENVLNALHNPTYHFKLYMTTERELVTDAASSDVATIYQTLDKLPKVVLAESGVTAGFNIQSVEIDTPTVPGFSNRSAILGDIKIRLVEPMGSSFLESMITAGMSLGVQNFSKFWYFLELTFRGYDEEGNIVASPLEPMNLTNGGRFIWCISINEVNFRLDEGKAEYTLSCTPYTSTAFSEDGTGMTPENLKVSGGTVKDFCDDLAKKMTEAWKRRYAGEIYTIKIVHRGIKDCKDDVGSFKLSQSEYDPVRGLKFEEDPSRAPVAQIPFGTRIDDIIVFLWAHCEGAQKLMLDTTDGKNLDDGEGETVTYNGKKYRMAVVPFVEADVKVTGYDIITGQYKKEITYNVWGWRTASANISPKQAQNVSDDPSVAKQIAQELRNKKYLRKRYYYRFTGKNTEVLKFDFDLNMAFSAILPRQTGWRANLDAVALHEKRNPDAAKDNSSYNDAKSEVKVNIQDINAKLDQYASDIRTQDEIINSTSSADDRAAAERRKATIQQEQTQLEERLRSIRQEAEEANRKQREEIEATAPRNFYSEDAQGTPLPFRISYAQRYGEPAQAAGIGFLGQWHRGTSLVGALLNQVYAPVSDGLMSVTLDIRGDPYWLGYSNLERRAMLTRPDSTDTMPDGRPNFAEGDNTFAIIVKFPAYLDGETGAPVIREAEVNPSTGARMGNADVFNGLYRVVGVKHTFEGGEFKQTLTANKLELVQTVNISGAAPTATAEQQK